MYLVTPMVAPLQDLHPKDVQYFGGNNLVEIIAQFNEISDQRRYDLITLLTDSKSYEENSKQK